PVRRPGGGQKRSPADAQSVERVERSYRHLTVRILRPPLQISARQLAEGTVHQQPQVSLIVERHRVNFVARQTVFLAERQLLPFVPANQPVIGGGEHRPVTVG